MTLHEVRVALRTYNVQCVASIGAAIQQDSVADYNSILMQFSKLSEE